MDAYSLLRKMELFADLSDRAVRSLSGWAQTLTYEKGERIADRHDAIQAFFLTASGKIKISRSSPDGKEQIFYLVGAGQPFCLCTAFSRAPYPVDVKAVARSTVVRIPSENMEELAREEPILLLRIMQTISQRLLDSMNLIESLSLHSIPQRVASFLLQAEAAGKNPEGEEFRLSVSHQEVSKIVGTAPETLSRILQSFKREDILRVSGRNIQILNKPALQDYAQG